MRRVAAIVGRQVRRAWPSGVGPQRARKARRRMSRVAPRAQPRLGLACALTSASAQTELACVERGRERQALERGGGWRGRPKRGNPRATQKSRLRPPRPARAPYTHAHLFRPPNPTTQARAYAADAAPPPAAASASLDWDKLTALVSTDEGKRELASLRHALAEGVEKLAARGGKGGAPDFAAAAAAVDPAVLAVLKQAYSDVKLPTLDPAASVAAVKDRFTPILEAAASLEKASAARAASLEGEIKAVADDIAKLARTTVDEELAADPKTAAKIDGEISRGEFY